MNRDGINDNTRPDTRWRATARGDKPSLFVCPLTGRLCKGDLSDVCEEYGCVRKAGLSPHSAENF